MCKAPGAKGRRVVISQACRAARPSVPATGGLLNQLFPKMLLELRAAHQCRRCGSKQFNPEVGDRKRSIKEVTARESAETRKSADSRARCSRVWEGEGQTHSCMAGTRNQPATPLFKSKPCADAAEGTISPLVFRKSCCFMDLSCCDFLRTLGQFMAPRKIGNKLSRSKAGRWVILQEFVSFSAVQLGTVRGRPGSPTSWGSNLFARSAR